MKAVVLLSGGVDSTTCLALAVDKYGADQVLALTSYYGQKHAKEIEAARKVAEFYGVRHIEQDMSAAFALSDSSLLAVSKKAVPHASYAEQLADRGGSGTVDTYVPFRNGLFLSFAAATTGTRCAPTPTTRREAHTRTARPNFSRRCGRRSMKAAVTPVRLRRRLFMRQKRT